MKTGCIRKYSDPTQQAVAHEKGERGGPGIPAPYPRVGEQNIHGDAAELEWKIPPVIAAAADNKS